MFIHIKGLKNISAAVLDTEICGYTFIADNPEEELTSESLGELSIYKDLEKGTHATPIAEIRLTYASYLDFLSRLLSEPHMIELGYKKKKNTSFR